MPKYIFRKGFDHAFEAEETTKGFGAQHLGLPGLKITLSKRPEAGKHYLYMIAEGVIPDPQELADALGYEFAGLE